jgi:2'-5' RNA ligase
MEGEEKLRSFISVEFPDEVVKEVARVQEVLGKKKFEGKLTELENLHLTLKFLGEIDGKTLEKVRKRLRKVKVGEMALRVEEIGTFNVRGRPRIVWVKIGGRGIFGLQKEVDKVLEGMFESEKRFMSHMTIARVKFVRDKREFIDYVKKIKLMDVRFKVDRFKLKISELKKTGPVYSDVEEYKAAG